MKFSSIPVWKKAPFVRLLIPFISGIIVQKHFEPGILFIGTGFIAAALLLLVFSAFTLYLKFGLAWLSGILVNIFVCFGAMSITYYQDTTKNPRSITRLYTPGAEAILTILEPLSKKPKSFKTIASCELINRGTAIQTPLGKIIVYFKKEDTPDINYGSRIFLRKKFEEIKNSGNPGEFDYKKFCRNQDIYYQVFLSKTDYVVLPKTNKDFLVSLIINSRTVVVKCLKRFIPGRIEAGLAEALLIGYKEDLDKKLVSSYSNTGVIHIVAISGLHVGLIYWLLAGIFNLIRPTRKRRFLKQIFIIAGLWIFSILAGGSPSVIRSAAMFTFIVVGNGFSKEISVYNSLAASAFLLLCYNPFWLWDAGFQLSYTAVLSIVVFMNPIYNLVYVENKILDTLWKLNAVTISAQVLTVPICLYYFHQFPTYFLVANLVAVPLSSVILLIEIILCALSFLPLVAEQIGIILYWLIRFMNFWIERVELLPFALIQSISFDLASLLTIYLSIIFFSISVFQRSAVAFCVAGAGILSLSILQVVSKIVVMNQRVFIVYNISSRQHIDFIAGNHFVYKGDAIDVSENSSVGLARFHFNARPAQALPELLTSGKYHRFYNKRILVIDGAFANASSKQHFEIDVLVLSHNARVSITDLVEVFRPSNIIFDSSNSAYMISRWKRECAVLGQACYSVQEKGAFVMNLN